MEKETLNQAALDYLNSVFRADPAAVNALLGVHIPTNKALEDHPHAIVAGSPSDDAIPVVGTLGIINGLLTALGLNALAGSYAFPTGPTDPGKLLGFRTYTPPEPPVPPPLEKALVRYTVTYETEVEHGPGKPLHAILDALQAPEPPAGSSYLAGSLKTDVRPASARGVADPASPVSIPTGGGFSDLSDFGYEDDDDDYAGSSSRPNNSRVAQAAAALIRKEDEDGDHYQDI